METLSVRCNHCGAPLQVSDAARFVTCQFCHSSLQIKRTESAIFTEEVARIIENTAKIAESLEVITLQNELEKLDREFGPHESATKRGGRGLAGGLLFAAFAVLVAICFFWMGSSLPASLAGPFPVFTKGMGIVILIAAVIAVVRSVNGEGRLARYQEQRTKLERQLTTLRSK